MYLVTRPHSQAPVLISLLVRHNIDATYLPVMELSINHELLNEFDLSLSKNILFSSPTSIKMLLAQLDKILLTSKAFCVGTASADLLAKYLPQHQIYYPKHASGIMALINEKKLNQLEQLTIIGGDKLNQKLLQYLLAKQINYQFINLYSRSNLALEKIAQTKKILSKPQIVGIIITSKLIAEYLVECANSDLLIKQRLHELKLITTHQQISEYLILHNYTNLTQTMATTNQAVVDLLRSL